jgi:hypothetical protein
MRTVAPHQTNSKQPVAAPAAAQQSRAPMANPALDDYMNIQKEIQC